MNAIHLKKSDNFNLALNKPTAQSSVYQPERYGYDPHGACNGKKNGGFGFCTLKENQPWWQIDLQGIYQLSQIAIYNRVNFEERARTLNILLSHDAVKWELLYSNKEHNLFGVDGSPLIINAHQKVARYVRLQLRENEHFHLDEVEIYGIPLKLDSSEFNENQETLHSNLYSSLETFNAVNYKGQLLQDKWVVMMTKGKKKGTFIEVGSTDGVRFNNTFCLEKTFSWTGICVEPNPDYFKKLCANRTAITLPYAFYKQSGQIVEFVNHGVLGTIADFSLSDFHGPMRQKFISEQGTIKVITANPEDILELYKFPEKFDFLSLDVEGAELEVLESFNLLKWYPAMACIEHNHVTHRRLAIFKLLSRHGYQRIECEFDDWYYNLDVLQVLNPDIPPSHYQQVLEYFCKHHRCKLIDEPGFPDPNLVTEKGTDSVAKKKSAEYTQLTNSGAINEDELVNIAIGKTAFQSSYSKWSKPDDPMRAINGVKDGKFSFCTAIEEKPWWMVDLGDAYPIELIKVFNREDCASERAKGLEILFSLDSESWKSIAVINYVFGGYLSSLPLIMDFRHIPNPERAKFVKLQLTTKNYLHLDEVEILASKKSITNAKTIM